MEHQADIETFELKADDAEEGVFFGYGATFNNLDIHGDVIADGAFRKSLSSSRKVKMLFQHDPKSVIGVWDDITENSEGLRVKGRLAIGTTKGREAYELIKMGALDSLSIGFKATQSNRDHRGRRVIKSADLMEISLVAFPANDKARITAVKEDMTIRDWEKGLRDAFDLSRSHAKIGAKALARAFEREAEDPAIAAMKDLTEMMRVGA